MKDYSLTALTGSRYIDNNGKKGILRRDLIKDLTKKQFFDLLEYKLACEDHLEDSGESGYFEIEIYSPTKTIKSIKLEISSILLSSGEGDNNTVEVDAQEKSGVKPGVENMFYIKKGKVIEINGRKAVFEDDYPVEGPKELINEIIEMKNNNGPSLNPQCIDLTIDNEDFRVSANSIIIEN